MKLSNAKRSVSLLLAVLMVIGLVPLSIISISAAAPVKLTGSNDSYAFSAGSWTIAEKAPNKETDNSTMTTADGKTFTDVGYGGTGPWQTNGGIATSVDSFDFSEGFTFKMTWSLLGASGGKWGNAHVMDFGGFQIVLADAVCDDATVEDEDPGIRKKYIDYTIGTGYSGTSNYNPVFTTVLGNYNTGVTSPRNMTEEDMATLNTIFTVVYQNGKVSLYVDSMKTVNNPTGLVTWTLAGDTTSTEIEVDPATMSNVQISLTKEWSWTQSQDVMVIDSLTGVDAAPAESGTTPAESETVPAESGTTPAESGTTPAESDTETETEHEHSFTNYIYNNDATCTTDGTKTATCECEETNTVVAAGTATGHDFSANADGKTKTCQNEGCGLTVGIDRHVFTPDDWSYSDQGSSTDGGNLFANIEKFEDAFTVNNQAQAAKYIGWGSSFTSKDALDLSRGFKFSFAQEIVAKGVNTWGIKSEITIGDAITLKVEAGKYTFKVGSISQTYNFSDNYTDEGVAKTNATFTIEYKDGIVYLYSTGYVSTTNESGVVGSIGLEDASSLASATIKFSTNWTHHSVDSTRLIEENTKVNLFSDVELDITSAPAAPVFEGVQEGTVGDVFSVRFVGTVASLDYSEVGFKITAMDGEKSWEQGTNVVYNKLIGSTDTGVVEYTKESLNGKYIYALTIKGVPATGTVVFKVTAYAIVDGAEITGTTYTVTYTDGAFVSMV